MPCYPRHEQGETQQDSCPEHGTPFRDDPYLVPQCPERYNEVEDVANQERGKEAVRDLLLERGVFVQVSTAGGEDEDINEAYECADVG